MADPFCKLLTHWQDKRIVLASASPRRKELMTRLGLKYDVCPSTFPELLDKNQFATPADYVSETARQKGLEVWNRLKQQGDSVDLLISADTIVVVDDSILEKPSSEEDAIAMLQRLNARCHQVQTAVWFFRQNDQGELKSDSVIETTQVVFGNNSSDLLKAYAESGEPMDKAGAYGYQGLACVLVREIRGCYYNVVGFPITAVFQRLLSLRSC